jgi:hypothetical protein
MFECNSVINVCETRNRIRGLVIATLRRVGCSSEIRRIRNMNENNIAAVSKY